VIGSSDRGGATHIIFDIAPVSWYERRLGVEIYSSINKKTSKRSSSSGRIIVGGCDGISGGRGSGY
jgi:hypothetical protein